MKPLELFVVHIDEKTKDTIKTQSGLELYVDTRFNEFEHRSTEGEVIAVPSKYETGVEPGDTLYFHHLVVLNEGQPLTGEDKSYIVKYSPDIAINNQAIAYKSKKDGEVRPLSGWALLESFQEEEKPEGTIEIVKLKEEPTTRGVVAFDTQELEELGVKKGDVVGFMKNIDYRILIDGKEYYRIPSDRLLCKF
jgi:co-chaperonin GroES (HSP10)